MPAASFKKATFNRHSAIVSAVAAALCTSALPGAALAAPAAQERDVTYELDIPPQDLHAALQQLALVSHYKLFYRSDLVSGKTSPGVKGTFSAPQALEKLLAGTDLTFEITSGNVVLIKGKEAATSSAAEPVPAATLQNVVEEIIVTAQKKEQSLQEVPMSVSAIGERTIELAGITNFTDYARMTPGISFSYGGPGGGQLGDRNVFIRGISSTNTTSGGQPVGFYIGETPVPFSDPNLFDINRIEVLRGPQGTLYGSGSLGGTVKIVPNAPNSQKFSSKVDSTLSTTHGGGINYEVRGMANIPLIEDRVAIRATVASRHDEGYIDNAGDTLLCTTPGPVCLDGVLDVNFRKNVNDVDKLSVRIASEIRLTDNLTITPSVFAERMEIADRARYTIGLENGPGGLLTNLSGPDAKEENNFALYDLGLKYDFGSATLTSSTSQMDWKKDNVLSLSYLIESALGLPGLQTGLASQVERDIFTHESRLASSGENSFDWLFGVFYQREDFTFSNYSAEPALPIPNKLVSVSSNRNITEQFAAFTEETLHVTDALSVTAGLRYFRTEVNTTRSVKASLFQGPVDYTQYLGPAEENGFTPKLAISYEVNDDVLLYALGARGFRAGGATRTPADIPSCVSELAALGLSPKETFESDKLWNYEAGAKTSWAGGRLTANLAGYYIDWDNIQQEIQLNCGFAFTTNFGKATSRGAELELKAAPVRGLDLGISIGYIDAQLAEASPSGVGKKGDATLQTPEWTVALETQYTAPVGFGLSAYVRGNYQYVDEVATTFNTLGVPDDAIFRPSYKVASFSAGLTNGVWEVLLFVQNAFDERPQFDSFVDSAGSRFPQAVTIQPRTVGITGRWSF